jgi:hypothetical protein
MCTCFDSDKLSIFTMLRIFTRHKFVKKNISIAPSHCDRWMEPLPKSLFLKAQMFRKLKKGKVY